MPMPRRSRRRCGSCGGIAPSAARRLACAFAFTGARGGLVGRSVEVSRSGGGAQGAGDAGIRRDLDPWFGLALSGPPGCESFARFRRPSGTESPLLSPCFALSNPQECRTFARFRRPSAAESLSLACPRESNQREGHPGAAPCGHPVLRVRASAPGFSDGTSLYRRKTRARPVRDPAGLFSADAPRHRGPTKERRAPARRSRGRACVRS
jgi:hypothetical protein